jgi:hypothetical protein
MFSELIGAVRVMLDGDEITVPEGPAASFMETNTFDTAPNPANRLVLVKGPPL